MANDESPGPLYREWLEKLREANEALRVMGEVVRIAQEGFKQYRHGLLR